MQVDSFELNGICYEFQPPIEVGNHQVDSLPKLAAIALMGANIPENILAMRAHDSEVALSKARGNELSVLNSMLYGKYLVTVE